MRGRCRPLVVSYSTGTLLAPLLIEFRSIQINQLKQAVVQKGGVLEGALDQDVDEFLLLVFGEVSHWFGVFVYSLIIHEKRGVATPCVPVNQASQNSS